jgi:hypothetical protein
MHRIDYAIFFGHDFSLTEVLNYSTCKFLQRDFFPKLVDIFRMCEDLENIDDLHMIFKLVKGISKYMPVRKVHLLAFLYWY